MNDTATKPLMYARNESGEVVSRIRRCKAFGHEFQQSLINPEWIETKREGAFNIYARDFEHAKDGKFWQPAGCRHPQCKGRMIGEGKK